MEVYLYFIIIYGLGLNNQKFYYSSLLLYTFLVNLSVVSIVRIYTYTGIVKGH